MSPTRALLFLAACGVLQACNDADQAPTASTPAPVEAQLSVIDVTPVAADEAASTYQDLQGNPVELAAYAGKKVFLNYWATWCAPCIREIPSISRAAALLADEDYVFLLASDESLETINNFLAEREFTGNFIKLNGFFGSHGVDAVPSSVLFDETGTPVKTWPGAFEWDSEEMLTAIRNAQ